jgi:hypothetical protein
VAGVVLICNAIMTWPELTSTPSEMPYAASSESLSAEFQLQSFRELAVTAPVSDLATIAITGLVWSSLRTNSYIIVREGDMQYNYREGEVLKNRADIRLSRIFPDFVEFMTPSGIQRLEWSTEQSTQQGEG